jgi:hypothetical protein
MLPTYLNAIFFYVHVYMSMPSVNDHVRFRRAHVRFQVYCRCLCQYPYELRTGISALRRVTDPYIYIIRTCVCGIYLYF